MKEVPFIPQKPTSIEYAFLSTEFKYIPFIDTSEVTSFLQSFNGCKASTIANLDFSSATNIANAFNSMTNLMNINNIANIKISGINLGWSINLNHDTLIRILNALYDYSEDSGTHTITLGTTNLAKLTEEEIAIGTDKNWTIN